MPQAAKTIFPGGDILLILGVVGLLVSMVPVGHEWAATLRPKVVIDLSPWALPGYAWLSLCRGMAAYLISLCFTLVYGYWAARHHASGRILIPLLDILQSIPVLGFMPGLVLGLIALFPGSNLGLELAAVLMIFTGQAWNMVFSFHASLTSLPKDQVEAAAAFRFTWWQRLRWVELPASTTGLVWNSMMSMAGGWFFLMVAESFRLGDQDFRLPGLGSYMSEALDQGDWTGMTGGILAMILVIVALDQVLWRPLVVWSERFRVEETARTETGRSWMLDLLRDSQLLARVERWLARPRPSAPAGVAAPGTATSSPAWAPVIAWLGFATLLIGLALGGWRLLSLLAKVPFTDPTGQPTTSWSEIAHGTTLTALRVIGSLVIGSLWAVPAGLAIGGSPRWSRRLQPVVQVAASFPAPMLFPLCLLIFSAIGLPLGIGSMVLMLLGTQWYILFNVIAGSQAIPSELREVATAFRFNRWQRFIRVELPAVLPALITGWVTAAGGAWNASVVAEYLTWRNQVYAVDGLGSTISKAAEHADYPALAAAVLTMAIVVVVINQLVWQRLRRLAETRFSLA